MAKVKVQNKIYRGWNNCVQITNGIVDLIITTDVGPRIIRYGFNGQDNELCEVRSTLGLTGGDKWKIYGGHRLWISPEDRTSTYEIDNSPVAWEEIRDGIKTSQGIGQVSGIRKEMEIRLSPEGTAVNILHRLSNKGLRPVELSAWSITAMATGGKEVVPQPMKKTGLLPNRVISLWPYTRLNDDRVYFGSTYIILRQDPKVRHRFKFGTSNEQGWAAYFNHNHLFVKYYRHDPYALYPDFGVSYETFTNSYMLEMETLSPLTRLKPSGIVEHEEKWELFDHIPTPDNNEAEIENILKGIIRTPR